jgi:hypothetical protein
MYWLNNNLAFIRNATSTSQLGRGIRKVISICGEIKDLVSNSDKHYTYLEDPNDIDLNNEFEERDEDEVEDLKRKCVQVICFVLFWLTLANTTASWERNHTAVQELNRLIPNFRKKIDEGSPEELSKFFVEVSTNIAIRQCICLLSRHQLQRGADCARSDDLNRIRGFIADWLNAAIPHPTVLLNPNCRSNRGLAHDVTGRLLCPADFDWDNLV